jgi:hypothetical protein
MNKSKKAEYISVKSFMVNLEKLVRGLPTDNEKNEIQNNLKKLIDFFNFLYEAIDMLPSSKDTNKIDQVIKNINNIINEIEVNPAFAVLFGLRGQSLVTKRRQGLKEEEIAKGKIALKNLESLSIDAIRSKLQSEEYSISEIRAIGYELGIKSNKGLNREALAHQITMKIANYRGYKKLSGKS